MSTIHMADVSGPVPTVFWCRKCDVTYTSAYVHPASGLLCPLCLRPLRRPGQSSARGAAQKARDQRARKIQRLGERDGWTCHLCGEAINPKSGRRNRRATLDHVIPKSLGGSNSLENLRLAHWICNNRRGNLPLQPQED